MCPFRVKKTAHLHNFVTKVQIYLQQIIICAYFLRYFNKYSQFSCS